MTSEQVPGQLPLFHSTFVRVCELPWPLSGFAYEAECRACDWVSPAARAVYDVARRDGSLHMEWPDEF